MGTAADERRRDRSMVGLFQKAPQLKHDDRY